MNKTKEEITEYLKKLDYLIALYNNDKRIKHLLNLIKTDLELLLED